MALGIKLSSPSVASVLELLQLAWRIGLSSWSSAVQSALRGQLQRKTFSSQPPREPPHQGDTKLTMEWKPALRHRSNPHSRHRKTTASVAASHATCIGRRQLYRAVELSTAAAQSVTILALASPSLAVFPPAPRGHRSAGRPEVSDNGQSSLEYVGGHCGFLLRHLVLSIGHQLRSLNLSCFIS